MTHDELIAKMDDIDIAISNGFGSAKVFLGCIKAVRTIIELHKPTQFENGPDKYKLVCSHCQLGVVGDEYPCETIDIISKELE